MATGGDRRAGRRSVGVALAELGQESRASRAVDRAIDASAPAQCRVGGVRDRVDRLRRDVTLDEFEPAPFDLDCVHGCQRATRVARQIVRIPTRCPYISTPAL